MDPVPLGELVATAGKLAGVARPLSAAVTVVGSGPGCDLRLDAPGVDPVHCLLAATPAGLAVRSLCPDRTRVNGAVTTARLLADGDTLEVGPLGFRVRLADEPVPLAVAPPDDPEAQDAALLSLVCARQQQFAAWGAELADRREEVRRLRAQVEAATAADRATATWHVVDAGKVRRDALADRERARKLVGRVRRRYARKHADVLAGAKQLRADRERFHADAHAQRERLAGGWDLLTDGQKRLVADRQAADEQTAQERAALRAWAAELAAEAAAREGNQSRVEGRVEQLLGEVARLDLRAAAGRAAVDKLERDRISREPLPEQPAPVRLPLPDRVPLVLTPQAAAGQLLDELVLRDRELVRSEAALDAARHELATQAAALYDDRLVLAEQLAVIAHARHAWQATECQIVAELEGFARGLARQELALQSRERQTEAREGRLAERTHDLEAARVKLEGWQALLATHEAAALADRDRLLAHAEAKRAALEAWEASLGDLFRGWCDEHQGLTRDLRWEIAGWQADRTRLVEVTTGLDREQAKVVAAAARVAAEAVAVQEAAHTLADAGGPQAERRLRVLRAGWERHFRRHATDLERRRLAVAGEALAADERGRELGRRTAAAADRERAAAEATRQAEADRLAKGRALDDRAVTLSYEAARMDRTRQELQQVRDEAETLARRLMGWDAPKLVQGGSRVGVLALGAA